jgi:hypothetical protein
MPLFGWDDMKKIQYTLKRKKDYIFFLLVRLNCKNKTDKKKQRKVFSINFQVLISIPTSTTLVAALMKLGKARLPTKASASIFRFWYRTSIVGISSPTL